MIILDKGLSKDNELDPGQNRRSEPKHGQSSSRNLDEKSDNSRTSDSQNDSLIGHDIQPKESVSNDALLNDNTVDDRQDDDGQDNTTGYVRALNDDSWYVQGSIGADTVEWLIDSGAGPNLLDYRRYNTLDPATRPSLLEYPTELLAAGGTQLRVYGEANVEVRFGSLDFAIPVVVADLGDLQGILGNRFIRSAEDVTFDLRKGTMTVGEQVCYLHERAGEDSCYVRIKESVQIPGNHEVQVMSRVSPNWPLATCRRGLIEVADDFELEHRKGLLHGNADALSRRTPTKWLLACKQSSCTECPSEPGDGFGTQGQGDGSASTRELKVTDEALCTAGERVQEDALVGDIAACMSVRGYGTNVLGGNLVMETIVKDKCSPVTEQIDLLESDDLTATEDIADVTCDTLLGRDSRLKLRETGKVTCGEPDKGQLMLAQQHTDHMIDSAPVGEMPTEPRPMVMTVTGLS